MEKLSDHVDSGMVDADETDISGTGNVRLFVLVVDKGYLLLVFQQNEPVPSQLLQNDQYTGSRQQAATILPTRLLDLASLSSTSTMCMWNLPGYVIKASA